MGRTLELALSPQRFVDEVSAASLCFAVAGAGGAGAATTGAGGGLDGTVASHDVVLVTVAAIAAAVAVPAANANQAVVDWACATFWTGSASAWKLVGV